MQDDFSGGAHQSAAAQSDAAATVRAYNGLAIVDIDQAWRLSSIMSWLVGALNRRRQAAPGKRRRANRLQMGNRGGIGRYQLRRAAAGLDRAAA